MKRGHRGGRNRRQAGKSGTQMPRVARRGGRRLDHRRRVDEQRRRLGLPSSATRARLRASASPGVRAPQRLTEPSQPIADGAAEDLLLPEEAVPQV